jgi:hypothetical protein
MRSAETHVEQEAMFWLVLSMLVNVSVTIRSETMAALHLTAKLGATWHAMEIKLRCAAALIA